jgi:hypothetical protein
MVLLPRPFDLTSLSARTRAKVGHQPGQRCRRGGGGLAGWAGTGTGQVEKVGALVGSQPECPGQGLHHVHGGVQPAALLQPYDVVDADPGQFGDFFAAQARGPAGLPALREPEVVRVEAFAPGPQERAQLAVRIKRS